MGYPYSKIITNRNRLIEIDDSYILYKINYEIEITIHQSTTDAVLLSKSRIVRPVVFPSPRIIECSRIFLLFLWYSRTCSFRLKNFEHKKGI